MNSLIVTYLPWLLSAATVYISILAGDKKRAAWAIGIAAQAAWLLWIVASQSWGLIPGNIALWIVYTRNYRKWTAA